MGKIELFFKVEQRHGQSWDIENIELLMPFPTGGFGMMQKEKNKTSDLKKIPGVGANMEQHLNNIGIHCISDLRGKDPEELYRLDCMKKGYRDDRCVLYVFRCAVYFAEQEQHEPEKLKWWYWKNREYPERGENQ